MVWEKIKRFLAGNFEAPEIFILANGFLRHSYFHLIIALFFFLDTTVTHTVLDTEEKKNSKTLS